MLRDLMDKVHNLQEQMNTVTEMEILSKKPKRNTTDQEHCSRSVE